MGFYIPEPLLEIQKALVHIMELPAIVLVDPCGYLYRSILTSKHY